MTRQLSLTLGRRARDIGEASATRHLSRYASEAIALEIRLLAQSGRRFTQEDVVARLSPVTKDSLRLVPNAAGAIVTQLARAGIIVRVGDQPSSNPSRRSARISVWRGKP